MNRVIAIDGPAGAGKSTIARRLAATLGYTYIDTGAMYRAVAWWAVERGVDFNDVSGLESLASAAEIELGDNNSVLLGGRDISANIRTPEISNGASRVAAVPGVRAALVRKQREIAGRMGVVMEGRDIGTVVFPNAPVKIFLDADPGERVQRRAGEQPDVPRDQLTAQIAERDARDKGRAESPLAQAPDAVYIDSTGLSLDEVEAAILRIVRERIPMGKEE